MPDVTNSIGGVSRINYYSNEGQVTYSMDVPEELADDPRIYAHDTAEPYGVLDNYDTSEQVLWNVAGYVENRIPVIERAREMKDDIVKLSKEIDAINTVLGEIREKAIKPKEGETWWTFTISPEKDDNLKMFLAFLGTGHEKEYYNLGQCAGINFRYNDLPVTCYTGSKVEMDLRSLSQKMNDFFDKYNWEIKERSGNSYASPPPELIFSFNRIYLEHLNADWNQVNNLIFRIPQKYRFLNEWGDRYINIIISYIPMVPWIGMPPK